jgi:GT2 family glycosyltransferase
MYVSVVIPNWNGAEYLKECIDSLLLQSIKCSVVVVDNGSTDESDKVLESYGGKIIVLKQKKNLGFAGGVNVGIRYALEHNADYVALFNNDAIADKEWAKYLIKPLEEDKKIVISTPKILKINSNIIDTIGTCYTIFGAPFTRGRNEEDSGQYDNADFVFGGSGCSSMYRASLFNEIGLFDEDFFAYLEEDDVNFRTHLAGYKVITTPKSVVHHHLGATSSRSTGFTTYSRAKNFWYLYTKNMPYPLFYKYLLLAIGWYFLMLFKHSAKGNFMPFIKGFLRSLSNTRNTLRKRKLIQKSRKCSSADIDKILFHGVPPKTIRK